MKDQYVGDIGDFGKYSLLRAFTDAGVKVGVNWYLTENDGSTDGKFTEYLKKNDRISEYDSVVFKTLKNIAFNKTKSVMDIQKSGILPGAVYYSALLSPKGTPSERREERQRWFEKSETVFKDSELIFMDPDNGLLEKNDPSVLSAEKYVLPDEVREYFMKGHNVVYYCHKGRRTLDQWFDYKSIMFEMIPEAKPTILTYHKGSQRSYIFLIQNRDYARYRKILEGFIRTWDQVFNEEYTNAGDVSRKTEGDSITLDRSDGSSVTVSKRVDGNLEIKTSSNPGTSVVISGDRLCQILYL